MEPPRHVNYFHLHRPVYALNARNIKTKRPSNVPVKLCSMMFNDRRIIGIIIIIRLFFFFFLDYIRYSFDASSKILLFFLPLLLF